MTDTILFGINITGSDKTASLIKGLSDNLVELTNKIKANQSEMKRLAKDNQQNSEQYKALSLSTKLLNEEKKDLTKTLQHEINMSNTAKNTIARVNAEVNKLKGEIKFLKIGSEEWIQTASKIETLENKQRDFNEAIGRGRTFVGEYARGFKEALKDVELKLKSQKDILIALEREQKTSTSEYKKAKTAVHLLEKEQQRLNHELKQQQANFTNTVKGFKDGFQKIGMAIAGVMVIWRGLNKVADFFSSSLEAYDKQQSAVQSLTTALGHQSIALERQASALQAKTKFGDEEIIQGQAYLAMLGLTEKQIHKITPAIVDFAAAKGMDLKSSFDLAGKSIGSETNALKRYAISIEGAAGSNERLESAVSSLNKMFGGQAEALAKTDGGLKQFQNSISDSKEIIGELVASILSELLPALTESITMFNNLFNNQKRLRTELELTTIGGSKAATIYEALNARYQQLSETDEKQAQAFLKSRDLQKIALTQIGDKFGLVGEDVGMSIKVLDLFIQDMQLSTDSLNTNSDALDGNSSASKKAFSDKEKDYAEYIKKIKELEDKLVTDKKTIIWNNYQNQLIIIDKLLISEDEKDKARLLLYNDYVKETEEIDQEYLDNQKKLNEQLVSEQAAMFDKMDEQASEQREEDKEAEELSLKEMAEIRKGIEDEVIDYVKFLTDQISEYRINKMQRTADKELDIVEGLFDTEEKRIREHYKKSDLELKQKLENGEITQSDYDTFMIQREAKLNADLSRLERQKAKEFEDIKREEFEKEKDLKSVMTAVAGATAIVQALAQLGPIAGVIAGIGIGITTATEMAFIEAQQFALSGRVKPGYELPGYSKSGDNTLALVKPGEVILNEMHQRMLGGEATFKRIGVPGFANSGIVPQPQPPTINVTVDDKQLAKSLNSIKVINVATETTSVSNRVYNEETSDDI